MGVEGGEAKTRHESRRRLRGERMRGGRVVIPVSTTDRATIGGPP